MSKIKKTDICQFLRFCVVGTSNAVIDFGVLNLLLWRYPTSDLWKTLEYNSIAVLLASTNSFFWNKYWTFQHRSSITFQEIYRFIVIASGTMLMNDTLMWLLGKAFPGIVNSNLIGSNILKLGAIIGTMSISFFGMRLWVFFQKRLTGEAQPLADDETENRSAIKLLYDVDTAIMGAVRPTHDVYRQTFASVTSIPAQFTAPESHLHTSIIPPTSESISTVTTSLAYQQTSLEMVHSFSARNSTMLLDHNSVEPVSLEQIKQRTPLPIPSQLSPRLRRVTLKNLQ